LAQHTPLKILGVDPGTKVMGYGIIEVQKQQVHLVCAGVVQLDHLKEHSSKLEEITNSLSKVIKRHQPTEMSIEAPFYAKNAQIMLKLGRAQGAAMVAATQAKVKVIEYSPKKVKQSITGNGNASKEQVAAMLQQLLKMQYEPTFLDATDAISLALCHHFQRNAITGTKKYSGWKAFIKDNPKKVKT